MMGDDDGRPWRSFAISPDGRTAAYFLFTGYDREPVPDRIILCDGKTGRLRRRLNDSGIPINGHEKLAFSADSRVLATMDQSVVHLWDVATGTKLRTLNGHRGEVRDLAFSRNGRLLATASSDSTVLVWDLTGRLRQGKLQPIVLSAKELEARWRDLADNDAVRAYDAIWKLAAADDQAVDFFKQQLHSVPQHDPRRLARLARPDATCANVCDVRPNALLFLTHGSGLEGCYFRMAEPNQVNRYCVERPIATRVLWRQLRRIDRQLPRTTCSQGSP
jgi:hypothetical protein